jgi:hypothetical protein
VRRRGLLKVHLTRASLPVLGWKAEPPPSPLGFWRVRCFMQGLSCVFERGWGWSASDFHVVGMLGICWDVMDA